MDLPIQLDSGRPSGGDACRRCDAAELLGALQTGSPADRLLAIGALRTHGAGAVQPLSLALGDRHPAVRAAAAEALGELGDERAVGPLIEALRASFVGRSARRQLALGLVIAVGVLAVPGGLVLGVLASGIGGWTIAAFLCLFGLELPFLLLIGVPEAAADYFGKRRSRGRLSVAYIRALARIAERHPVPELRQALPELQALSVDVLQQQRSTRAASRATAQRIKMVTARLKDLPTPAAAGHVDAAVLPCPSAPAPWR
jgi:hypothetical protein